ncbi:MAG: acylphosphatase [Pirellulales bacterium]|nr:acylphosphatase [Pirellulales bacterium]
METTPARREVVYHGRVQGVGFRYTTVRLASRFAVSGYVQNLHDGRVKLVAEGQVAEIEAFLTAIAGHFAAHIDDTNVRPSEATGEFNEFEIRP